MVFAQRGIFNRGEARDPNVRLDCIARHCLPVVVLMPRRLSSSVRCDLVLQSGALRLRR